MTTEEFIRRFANDEVRTLALKAHSMEGVDAEYALNQISGRQMAKKKIPMWAGVDGLKYPPHLSMEQCSSEQTAKYKAEIVKRLSANKQDDNLFVDLTGGFGVDFSFMARNFKRAIYVERQKHLCEMANVNFKLLGLDMAEVMEGDAEEVLKELPQANIIFIDPARRDTRGNRTFAISDCTPDVSALADMLLEKADYTLIKLSPMLDLSKAIDDLGGRVSEAHIVSVGNECKELLLVLTKHCDNGIKIYCINDDERLEYDYDENKNSIVRIAETIEQGFLYEPNSSIMKAGCFGLLCKNYDVEAVGHNSHLFVSTKEISDFPGRRFKIETITTMNKKTMRQSLKGIDRANIAVRNFPMSVDELRQRLKLHDGGDTYIFATTIGERNHVLLICQKHRQ